MARIGPSIQEIADRDLIKDNLLEQVEKLRDRVRTTEEFSGGISTVTYIQEAAPGSITDHGDLSGLADDDHLQYVGVSASRVITAIHNFSPPSPQAPFTLAANAQGQTITGLRADQLDKQVIAGDGLTGGGALTADRTVTLGGPGTLSATSTDQVTTSSHTHAITASSDPGFAESILKTAPSGLLQLKILTLTDASAQFAAGYDLSHYVTIYPADQTTGRITTLAQDLEITPAGTLDLNGTILNLSPTSNLNLTPGGIITATSAGTLTLQTTNNGDIDIAPGGTGLTDVAGTDLTFTGSGDVYPGTNYVTDLGLITNKWLTLHAAELAVETIVARDTQATIGGRVLVGPTTILEAQLTAAASSMDVRHNNLANGDRVRLEAGGNVEWIAVTSAPSGTGPYTYSITRDLDGSGANQWEAGTAVFNTGTTGDGFIDLYSLAAAHGSGQGPTIVGNVRTGTTYSDLVPGWAIGHLEGVYGQSSGVYGLGLGRYAAGYNHVLITDANGIQFKEDTGTVRGSLDGDTWILGDTTTEYVQITPTALQFIDGGSILGSLSGGEWNIGATGTEHIRITGSLMGFYDGGSLLGTLSAGIWTIGNTSTEHITVTSTSLTFYDGGTSHALLNNGVLRLGESNNEHVTLDGTNGLRFYGADGTTIRGSISGDQWTIGTSDTSTGSEAVTDGGLETIQIDLAATEQLTNGDFETLGGGGADVFGTWVEDATGGSITAETVNIFAGTYSAKLTNSTGQPKITQTSPPLSPGTYIVTFFTRGDGTNAGQWEVYNATLGSLIAKASTGITGTTYTAVAGAFTIPDGTTDYTVDVILYAPTAAGDAYYDAVSLKFSKWTNWTATTNGLGKITPIDVKHGGTYGALIERDTAGASEVELTQVLSSLAADTNYTLEFWTRGDGAVAAEYRVSNAGGDLIPETSTGIYGTTWTKITTTFYQTSSGNVTLYFRANDVIGKVYIDDVSVKPITVATQMTVDPVAGIRFWDTAGSQVGQWINDQITLGQPTDRRVEINSTGIRFYAGGGLERGHISGDGQLVWFGDGPATERLQYDGTNGLQLFDGTNTAIVQFSPSGDGEIIGSLKVNGGEVLAGSSAVKINDDGIGIAHNTDAIPPAHPTKAIKWGTSTYDYGRIMLTYREPGPSETGLDLELLVNSGIGTWTTPTGITITYDTANGNQIELDSTEISITGTIVADGDLYLGGGIRDSTAVGVLLRRSSAQSIGNNSYTNISWNSQLDDPYGMWGTGTNMTVQQAGIYLITAYCRWANNNTGTREILVNQGGAVLGWDKRSAAGTNEDRQTVTAMASLSASTVITIQVYQSSGGSLNMDEARVGFYRIA